MESESDIESEEIEIESTNDIDTYINNYSFVISEIYFLISKNKLPFQLSKLTHSGHLLEFFINYHINHKTFYTNKLENFKTKNMNLILSVQNIFKIFKFSNKIPLNEITYFCWKFN